MPEFDYLDIDQAIMSADTCSALSQIIPVLLLALIAERIVVSDRKRPDLQFLGAILLFALDLVLASALTGAELAIVVGIERGGLNGFWSIYVWNVFGAAVVFILGRWAFRSPAYQVVIRRAVADLRSARSSRRRRERG